VKVQVEWNADRVRVFRQVGYLRHQLKKEDFRNNKIDAAEISAAESGNALYVVQVDPGGQGPLGVVRVRYKVPFTREYTELEWSLAYEQSVTPLEHAGPAMRGWAVLRRPLPSGWRRTRTRRACSWPICRG